MDEEVIRGNNWAKCVSRTLIMIDLQDWDILEIQKQVARDVERFHLWTCFGC